MPANGSVKIVWQIVFLFIPVLNLWAFYRIKKLKKFLVMVWLPEVVITIVIIAPIVAANVEQALNENPMLDDSFLMQTVLLYVVETSFTVLAIYLIYKWSKEWNQKFQAFDNAQ